MNKDVIYIDVDDDVTAIIGKIKKSKEKIVAVVPPKRAGALQSAVNLRLLDRMAKAEKKQLVVITNNQALVALAANAAIPVAKNLQTKPEIADVPALSVDDGDDIIDGSELPVGDHAATAKIKGETLAKGRSEAMDEVNVEDDDNDDTTPVIVSGAGAVAAKKAASSSNKVKIPNFDVFRKRLFLAIGGGILLVALLVWMFVFAPAATVVITAQTTPAPVSATIKLDKTAATDFSKGIVKAIEQEETTNDSIEFDATGTDMVGENAAGQVVFKNCEDDSPITIAAGTVIVANGRSYKTQATVTVPEGSGGFGGCVTPGTSSQVAVKAEDVGSEYNTSSGTTFSVVGHPNSTASYMRAVAVTDIDGGTSKEVKVATKDDVERAKGQLAGEATDEKKAELIAKFTNGEKVVDGSFVVDRSDVTVEPGVGKEAPASGKVKLTVKTKYTIWAIAKSEVENYLNASLNQQIDANTQQVYGNGIDEAGLADFKKEGKTLTASITATGQTGPKINEQAVKEQVKGKIYGDVQSSLESLEGIKDVDVKFSFFWVRTVPNDTNKIHIEFKLENE